MVHRAAKLVPFWAASAGRAHLIEGWTPTIAPETVGVSHATAYKWLCRYRAEGVAALEDRSARPIGVLRRHGGCRLVHADRLTGRRLRYVRERPGEMLARPTVEQLGRVPDGGVHTDERTRLPSSPSTACASSG